MPFAVLVGAMFCYLNLSRRLELVVARAAGISAWQFIAPAIIIAWLDRCRDRRRSTIRSPRTCASESTRARGRAVRAATEAFAIPAAASGCASAAMTARRSSTPNRAASRASQLGGVSVFRFDAAGHFRDRIEAKSATPRARLLAARGRPLLRQRSCSRSSATASAEHDAHARAGRRKLRDAGDRAVLAAVVLYRRSPRTPAWPPPAIDCNIISCWRSPSISWPWCCWPPSVSLRFFRFGGVQKIVLGGIAAGFLLYVMAKITGDLSKAGLMAADDRGGIAAGRGRRDRPDRAAVPGGWVMARPATHPRLLRRARLVRRVGRACGRRHAGRQLGRACRRRSPRC